MVLLLQKAAGLYPAAFSCLVLSWVIHFSQYENCFSHCKKVKSNRILMTSSEGGAKAVAVGSVQASSGIGSGIRIDGIGSERSHRDNDAFGGADR